MRIEATVTSVSWIPSESMTGPLALGMDLGLSHYDDPPPDKLKTDRHIYRLRDADKCRFANLLVAWVEVEDNRIVAAGFSPDSVLVMGRTKVGTGRGLYTFQGFPMPVLQLDPDVQPDQVHFTQTAGCRTGVPLPRPVPERPFAQWRAPIIWTTLVLTLRVDGLAQVEMTGASPFPRHWVYGPDGELTTKSAVTDLATWMRRSFGIRTPWGEDDSEVLIADAESRLERQMSDEVMRSGQRPKIRRLPPDTVVVRQGDADDQLFLLLDGVLAVEVDGKRVAEVGPGAMVGERAVIGGGIRTSTLIALTPVRVAVADADAIDIDNLRALAQLHVREDAQASDDVSG